jgi:hypothetical protein
MYKEGAEKFWFFGKTGFSTPDIRKVRCSYGGDEPALLHRH